MGNKTSCSTSSKETVKIYRYQITPYIVLHRHTRRYIRPTQKNRSNKIDNNQLSKPLNG